MKRNTAQSTVEYILLVTAVIAVGVIFLGPTGMFHNRLNATLDTISQDMFNMSTRVMPPATP